MRVAQVVEVVVPMRSRCFSPSSELLAPFNKCFFSGTLCLR